MFLFQYIDIEIASMGCDDTNGMVRNYSPMEVIATSAFPEIPAQFLDVHLGKLLFAHAKAPFRSLELRQYRPETEMEKVNRRKAEVSVSKYSVMLIK